ncbi:hypothetical protein NKG94_07205 [Micromonospora sp. M12]
MTLVGPGGVGKTRLATETARGQSFPDGVQLVELAPLPAGDAGVAEQVLGALGAYEAVGASLSPPTGWSPRCGTGSCCSCWTTANTSSSRSPSWSSGSSARCPG